MLGSKDGLKKQKIKVYRVFGLRLYRAQGCDHYSSGWDSRINRSPGSHVLARKFSDPLIRLWHPQATWSGMEEGESLRPQSLASSLQHTVGVVDRGSIFGTASEPKKTRVRPPLRKLRLPGLHEQMPIVCGMSNPFDSLGVVGYFYNFATDTVADDVSYILTSQQVPRLKSWLQEFL